MTQSVGVLKMARTTKTTKNTVRPKPPKGWFAAGLTPESYEMSIDRTEFHSGTQCAYLRSCPNVKMHDWGTLMQNMPPRNYLGKRIQMSFWVKTKDVEGWVQGWLRVDGKDDDQYLAFDNMCNRTIRGTNDWTKHTIVLDVPEESTNIAFGIMLGRKGCVWLDDVSFDAVSNDVPTTECSCSNCGKVTPTNLDFEEEHDGECR